TRTDGMLLLLFFSIFMAYNIIISKKTSDDAYVETGNYTYWGAALFILLGLGGLVLGGRLIVVGAVSIAESFGLSERVIGLTIVSIGTSLPELATSVMAVRRKNVDIAI